MTSQIIPKETKEDKDESGLIKIYNYMALTFVILIIIDIIIILIQGFTDYNLALFYVFFVLAAMCFGVGALIKQNPSERKRLFRGFIVSAALVGIIAILVISAYQW